MMDMPITSGMGPVGLAALFVTVLVTLIPVVFMTITMWQLFVKAGLPGWGAIIPFYNGFLFVKLAGKPGWWFLLMFVPLVNCVIALLLPFGVAKCFGKSAGFAVGLIFVGIVFFPILAFGSAEYAPPSTEVLEEEEDDEDDDEEDDEDVQEAVAIAEVDDDSV
jgi:hypothetical protein